MSSSAISCLVTPLAFIDAITNAHPEAAACAAKLRYMFEMNLRSALTDDEVAYVALHVARLALDLRA